MELSDLEAEDGGGFVINGVGGKGKDIFKLSTGKGYGLIQNFRNWQSIYNKG